MTVSDGQRFRRWITTGNVPVRSNADRADKLIDNKPASHSHAAFAAGGRLLSYAPGCYTVPVTVRTLCPGVTVQEPSAFWVNVASGTVSLPATVAKAPVAAS